MRIAVSLVAGLAMILLSAFAASAEVSAGKRVALVIGNAQYKHAVPLANPVKDAKLIAATLRDAGFEVIEGLDLDKTAMQGVIDRFTEASYDADVGLVYYSGHGMQVDGHNYLIPIDAELTAPAHLKTRTVQAEEILASLPPDPSVGILILDACRDNPLSRSLLAALPATRSNAVGTGLAAVQAANTGTGTGGTLIAYATDPGAVALDGKGANSPYTIALAKYLASPGVELQSALVKVRGEVTEATMGKQRPWHNASLGREVFLGGKPEAPKSVAAAPAATSEPAAPVATAAASGEPSSWEIEQRLWDEASKRNSVPHYEVYLDQFPNGRFAAVARLNIDQLKEDAAKGEKPVEVASASPTAGVDPSGSAVRTGMTVPDEVKSLPGTEISEAAIGLDREKRRDLQLRLRTLGFDVGSVDGSIGPRSRRAISEWQTRHSIVASGYLTQQQYTLMTIETDPMMAAVRAEHEAALAAQRQRAEKEAVQRQAERKQAQKQAQKQTAQKQTTQKQTAQKQTQKRKQKVEQQDEKIGRVEDEPRDDSMEKALLFGTGVAVGTILLKKY